LKRWSKSYWASKTLIFMLIVSFMSNMKYQILYSTEKDGGSALYRILMTDTGAVRRRKRPLLYSGDRYWGSGTEAAPSTVFWWQILGQWTGKRPLLYSGDRYWGSETEEAPSTVFWWQILGQWDGEAPSTVFWWQILGQWTGKRPLLYSGDRYWGSETEWQTVTKAPPPITDKAGLSRV
jgi:hypothetical protein